MSADNWVSIADAMPTGLSEEKQQGWREELIRKIFERHILTRARRETKRWIYADPGQEFSLSGVLKSTWDGQNILSAEHPSDETNDKILGTYFWCVSHANCLQGWSDFCDGYAYYTDWVRGEFAVSYPIQEERRENYSPRRVLIWALDVDVDAKSVEKFNRPYQARSNEMILRGNSGTMRPTQYDWTGAIIHLTALAELDGIAPSPDAHGAQAHIEKIMADWFVLQGKDQPSEAAIRPYAKKILDAIRGQAQKG